MIHLTHAFGLTREPFDQHVPLDQLYPLPGLDAFLNRFEYALRLGLITVMTGEVGSGKSTSLRCAAGKLHPSQFRAISLIATTGTMLELMRQLCLAFGIEQHPSSLVRCSKLVRDLVQDITSKKQTPLLLIDEAHLLRHEIFTQLHTLLQFSFDSQALLPIVLSGQTHLIDKLLYHTSKPFASRIVGRTHLEALQHQHMHAYLQHHLKIAGADAELFADEAITAIHQGSGGLLRRANNLARGAMTAAAHEKAPRVTAEHVRLASTEIL